MRRVLYRCATTAATDVKKCLSASFQADVDRNLCTTYFDSVSDAITSRKTSTCWLLNIAEIQDCIDQVSNP